MTCPPRRRSSYFAPAGWPREMAASPRNTSSEAALRHRSRFRRVMPLRRPFRAEVFTHIERATHLPGRDGPGERERERVAVLLGVRASEADRIAVDRAGQIPRHEVALMRSVDVLVALSQVKGMRRRAGGVLDADLPLAGQIDGRRGGGSGRRARRMPGQD